jgi:peptide-methionine (S)-S-oxide reductase
LEREQVKSSQHIITATEGKMAADMELKMATLGGGCFWCLEPVYEELQGVQEVVVGYAGGEHPAPDYKLICTGTTGHAEVVQVTYDPQLVSYNEILEIFFSVHDPTTPNRQGADVGTQYRSIILYHDEDQKLAAEALIKSLDGQEIWKNPIVTQIAPLETFFPAEDYHQGYYRKNPGQGYCMMVVAPKLKKFRQKYAERLKEA